MAKELRLDIPLNPKQELLEKVLFCPDYRDIIPYGASRSGKTFEILHFFAIMAIVFKVNSLVVRKTYSSLTTGFINQTIPAWKKAVAQHNGLETMEGVNLGNPPQPFCKFNIRTNQLVFFTGNFIQFASLLGSATQDTSFDKILSTEFAHIFADEASEIPEDAIGTLRTRLAVKITHPDTGQVMKNKMILAMNPPTKSHWTYRYFFRHIDSDGLPLKSEAIAQIYPLRFKAKENSFVSDDYWQSLDSLSYRQRLRYQEGVFADEITGRILREITWGPLPDAEEFTKCIIYTDPSAKESSKNDYKASVLIGIARNYYYVIDSRAVQGSSREMMDNIYALWKQSPVPPRVVMEKKSIPLDFDTTFTQFQEDKNWICPLEWDTLNHGDKFYCIESTLEPLMSRKRLIVNEKLRYSPDGELFVQQVIGFGTEDHDDIPDALAKGISTLNRMGAHILETAPGGIYQSMNGYIG